MTRNVYFDWFIHEDTFPFFIQYGKHEEDMYVHTHADFTELVIILGGVATHIVDGEEYPIKKGDVFVINDRTSHGYKNPKDFKICNIMFHPSYFFDSLTDIKTSAGFHALFVIEPVLTSERGFQGQLSLSMEQCDQVNALAKRLFQEFQAKDTGYQTMITSLLSELITLLSRLYHTEGYESKQSVLSIASAVAYMENHYAEDLPVETLAELAGMSDRHFRRIFHNIYNTSPAKYLAVLRIQSAMKLLANSELSVTEIALRCGFPDSNYFSSRFKKTTGKTPLEYRQYQKRLFT